MKKYFRNNSKYFRGELVENLITSDILKKRQEIIKEFTKLNQGNRIDNKRLTINVKLEILDSIKKKLMIYNDRNYLDALEKIHSLYDEKETKDAIDEIKPLIHNIERSVGENVLTNVRENPKTINICIREYGETCKKKLP
ncbi:MAG: hypothetical protein CEE43_17765 [Promethearchaeota archaeon Loki_b32]|nr:MAG: hypothetical protein CEE43_17765 [Candidatus Lokiarchaeota archaeon Loki_b32]